MSGLQEQFLDVLEHYHKKNPEAWKRFMELGLPDQKGSYQYARLRPLLNQSFQAPTDTYQGTVEQTTEYFIHLCGATGKVLKSKLPKGIYLAPYNQVKLLFGSVIDPVLKKRTSQESDPFCCLTRALSKQPLILYIPPKLVVEQPISVRMTSQSQVKTLSFTHLMVVAGKESHSQWLFEGSHEGDMHWSHRLLDLHLEAGARVEMGIVGHLDTFQEGIRAHLERDALFKCTSAFFRKGFSRQDYRIQLVGKGAHADLQGVSLLSQTSQAHTNVLIEHLAPSCTSNQTFRQVVGGSARASFEGKIYVHQPAQQTSAYQLCNSLLLSEEAKAFSKPNLEIFADDVKASHGATFGQLNQKQLFYLTSRGIPEAEAKRLLIEGFVKEIVEQIPSQELNSTWFDRVAQDLLLL